MRRTHNSRSMRPFASPRYAVDVTCGLPALPYFGHDMAQQGCIADAPGIIAYLVTRPGRDASESALLSRQARLRGFLEVFPDAEAARGRHYLPSS